jgi:hypothetical protein
MAANIDQLFNRMAVLSQVITEMQGRWTVGWEGNQVVCETPEMEGLPVNIRATLSRVYGMLNNNIIFYFTKDVQYGNATLIQNVIPILNTWMNNQRLAKITELQADLTTLQSVS